MLLIVLKSNWRNVTERFVNSRSFHHEDRSLPFLKTAAVSYTSPTQCDSAVVFYTKYVIQRPHVLVCVSDEYATFMTFYELNLPVKCWFSCKLLSSFVIVSGNVVFLQYLNLITYMHLSGLSVTVLMSGY